MNELTLSFSALESYKTCPRKYFYNYLLKLPKKQWPWFTFGNFNHLVLEKFHNYIIFCKKRNLEYSKRQVMKKAYLSALKKWIILSNKGKQGALSKKQVSESKKLLSRYMDKVTLNEPNVLSTEMHFKIDLGDGLFIRGFIDRIDKINERTFKIVDYKTSKEAYEFDKNNQLDIYAIGLKHVLQMEDIEIWKQLDFLKVGETSPLKAEGAIHDQSRDEALLADIKKRGLALREKRITDKQESQWEPIDNDFCWCCDFKYRCHSERGILKGNNPGNIFN